MTKQPSYRFAGYTEPWSEKKLGEIIDINSGESPAKFHEGYTPYVKVDDLNYCDKYLTTTKTYVDTNNKVKKIEKGSIVFPKRGAAILTNKIRILNTKAYMDTNMMSLSTDKSNLEFLYTVISNVGLYKIADTSTIPQINNKHILPYIISLPSLPEQTAIGSFFQDIDQFITLQQRKLEVLKEQKKTYLKLLFPAKGQTKPALRFAGFEDDWKEVKLGEVFDIVTDYVANGSFESLRNNVRTYEKDNFAYMIRLQDASNSWKGPWLYTDEKGYNFLSKSRLFKDDILMSNVGTVGRFFQVPELDRPMTLAPNSVLIRSTSSNNQFLYFMMLTANIQDQITMRKTPGVQDKINKTDFKRVIATLPALPEQEAIASFFQDLDKAIAKQEEKVNQLKESKQTLLRKMFI